MRVTLTIDCNGATFDENPAEEVRFMLAWLGGPAGAEKIQRVLREANESGEGSVKVKDYNGNACGRLVATREE